MDLKQVGWEGVDWIKEAQDCNKRWGPMNTEMKLKVI